MGSAGTVVVIALAVVVVGTAAIVGLSTAMTRRDFRRRTFSADAWAAAGYGIPQAAVDRALAAPDPYPAEAPPTAARTTTKPARARTTTTRTKAAKKTAKSTVKSTAKKTAARSRQG